jgi:hypothetical protein
MRLSNRNFANSIAFLLLCASAGSVGAQNDSARSATQPLRAPFVGAWATGGLGSASFAKARINDPFPPGLQEGWLALGPVVLGLRRVDAGAGINTTERISSAWLLGARTTLGPLLLIIGAGSARVSGRDSNGEQSGSTTPIEAERAWTAEGELSFVFGRYLGLGAATFRTGGTRARSSGTFIVVQVGRLR